MRNNWSEGRIAKIYNFLWRRRIFAPPPVCLPLKFSPLIINQPFKNITDKRGGISAYERIMLIHKEWSNRFVYGWSMYDNRMMSNSLKSIVLIELKLRYSINYWTVWQCTKRTRFTANFSSDIRLLCCNTVGCLVVLLLDRKFLSR